MRAVREAHSGLLQRADSRGQRLWEQLQLHQLEQEALLLDAWLGSKAAIAESQDYGQDVEAVSVSQPPANLGESALRLQKGKEVCLWGGKGVSGRGMGTPGLWGTLQFWNLSPGRQDAQTVCQALCELLEPLAPAPE